MFTIIADVAVLGIIGYCGLLGYTRGMRPALVVAMELFFSLALSLLLAETFASILGPLLGGIGGRDFDAEAWGMLLAFIAVFAASIAILQAVVPKSVLFKVEDDESFADDAPLSLQQQIGGAVMGASCGLLLVGIGLILLSMVPLPVEYRFRSTAMLYDVGAFCLRGFSHVAGEGYGGRAVLVFGEPGSTQQEATAKLSSEGYTDLDGDKKCTESDAHYDLDDSGTYSADLYYLDLDADNARRVGLLEKYVTAQWGVNPSVTNRERPGSRPAAPPQPEEGAESEAAATPPPQPAAVPKPDEPDDDPPPAPAGDDF